MPRRARRHERELLRRTGCVLAGCRGTGSGAQVSRKRRNAIVALAADAGNPADHALVAENSVTSRGASIS